MPLARFSVIVAVDIAGGIARDGALPWHSREDMKYFRDVTTGRGGKNVVVMGRNTYESIPQDHRPLENRYNVVISNTWRQEEHPEVVLYSSLLDALTGLGNTQSRYDEIFICGGERVYREIVPKFLYLCDRIHVTRFKTDFQCDQFFDFDAVKDLPLFQDLTKARDYTRYIFSPKLSHPEQAYLNLLEEVLKNGEQKTDRTGVGVLSVFGQKSLSFDISSNLPVFTTRKISYATVIRELLFFISGKTDTKILEAQDVKIWKANTRASELAKRELPYEEGDAGPFYGFQWRHWGAEYQGCDVDYTGKGVDQLKALIEGLRLDPHSRRHILTAWNPGQNDQMVLPPCHSFCQFNVSADKRHLDCALYQRSGDLFLGVPFNVTSYAMLTYMIGHITGYRPRRLTLFFGDAHIYLNHRDAVGKIVKRTPHPFPSLIFRNSTRLHEIDDFTYENFDVVGYTSWPAVQAPMAV